MVLDAQLLPGSFEYALDYLIDQELDLSALHERYNNDATGAPGWLGATSIHSAFS